MADPDSDVHFEEPLIEKSEGESIPDKTFEELGPGEAAEPIGHSRPTPSPVDPESSFLGSVLVHGSSCIKDAQARGVSGRTFTNPSIRIFFDVASELFRSSQPCDMASVAAVLKSQGRLTEANTQLLFSISGSALPTTASLSTVIECLLSLERRRDSMLAGQTLIEAAKDSSSEIDSAIADAQRRLKPPKTSGSRGLTVWTPAQLRQYVAPAAYSILGDGFIQRKELTTLIGPPGIGKSRLSGWLAVSHITGREFLGLATRNHPARWLMIGNEDSKARQQSDLDWFYRSLTSAEQALVDAHLFTHVLDSPDDGALDLGDQDAVSRIEETIRSVRPDVIRFDPWANMIAGDENDTQDTRDSVRRLMSLCRRAAPDAAIIVIHHARTGQNTVSQAGSRYSGGSLGRGSKVLVGAARCELALWPGDRDDSDKLVLTCEKCNNAKPFAPIGLLFENGIYLPDTHFDNQAWRDDVEGKRFAKTVTIEDIVETVRKGRVKFKDILEFLAEDTGASKVTIARRIKDSVAKGYLKKSQPAGSYSVVEKHSARKPYKDDSDF